MGITVMTNPPNMIFLILVICVLSFYLVSLARTLTVLLFLCKKQTFILLIFSIFYKLCCFVLFRKPTLFPQFSKFRRVPLDSPPGNVAWAFNPVSGAILRTSLVRFLSLRVYCCLLYTSDAADE